LLSEKEQKTATKEEARKALEYHLRAKLGKDDFWEFCKFYDKDFFLKRKFLQRVARAFQRIEEGKINSLSVSVPPRGGKSYITTLFCAWTLGRNPSESVMRNTCTGTLYQKFSYDVRQVLKSEKFNSVFPEVSISNDKANLNGWNTNQSRQVGYFGAGVGGTIIGFGATKLAITDDLYRGIEDALSDVTNDRVLQWKEGTHDSRLERTCAKIDIGTRWSTNDVIGKNFQEGSYDESIVIPALDANEETFCADVMSTDQYKMIRKKINPDIWSAEYMQEPVDLKGRLFSNLRTISEADFNLIKGRSAGSIAYVDVSDQGADYTAMALAVIIDGTIYIADYCFNKNNTDVTIPLIAEKLNRYRTSYCRVESNSMGSMFARNLQKITRTKILQVHNTQNKMTRIIMQSASIINSFVFVKHENSNDYHQFMQNLLHFSKEGKNKNDDSPDCLAGLSMLIKSLFRRLDI
jgi:predicted phage terminase large subunit-like protein